MMIGGFGDLADAVDESEAFSKVIEFKPFLKFFFLEIPADDL